MKRTILLLLILIPLFACSQVERSNERNYQKHNVGSITACLFDTGEKTVIWLRFPNEQYQYIVDTGSIWINNQKDAEDFVVSLMELAEEPRRSELTLHGPGWVLYSKRGKVVFANPGLTESTRIRKGQCDQLIRIINRLSREL